MPRTVLMLDVMSTLVSEPFYEDIPRFLGLTLDELRVRRNHQAFLDFEMGLIDEETYGQRFYLDDEVLDVEGMKATLRSSVELLPGVEHALSQLKQAEVPMYALSNYSEWYRVIDEATGLSRFLDWSFVSCRTGHRKPDPRAYLGPVETLGLAPGDCLFVDDRRSNVAGAEAVGMPALLRTPDMDLLQALTERGVLAESPLG